MPALSRRSNILPLLVAASFLAGCSTYEDDTKALANHFHAGEYALAAAAAKDGLNDAPDRDKLVWKLEYAAAERAAGNWSVSNIAFEDAEADLVKWDEAPDLLLSNETAATLVNLTYLPYRGTGYDRIMAATYRALNELALGNIDRARVELNRTMVRQDEVAKLAQKKVEAARQEAAEASSSGEGVDVNKSANDPATTSKLDALYGDLKTYRIYGDYVNPFSIWLHGVFRLATAEGNADIETAHKSLERLSRLTPGCKAAMADYATSNKVRDGAKLPPTVWIVFETGMAPHKVEERIDIPLFIVSGTVPYAGIALPKLNFNGGATPSLAVESGGRLLATTETVASMDAVVATDFDNEKTVIITRSIITAGLKVAAQYAANKAAEEFARQNGGAAGFGVYLGTMVATGVASYATTQADLRTWRTLPKSFQIARIDPPADGKLRLVGSSPAQAGEITLPPGSVFLVIAKATDAGTPLTVSVTTLRGLPVGVHLGGTPPKVGPLPQKSEIIPAGGVAPQGAQ